MSTEQVSGRARLQLAKVNRVALLVVGGLLVAAGLGVLTATLIGTSSSSTPAEQVSVAQRFNNEPDHIFDRAVELSSPTPKSTPKPTPSPTPGPPPPPPLPDTGFHVIIPRISVNAPVNAYGLDAQAVPEVPLNGYEVAWYNWSARPGTGSNAVLAGHVTWSGAAVFYNLGQLSPGDEIILRADDGAEISYEVKKNYLVDPNDPEAVKLMHPTDDDILTVITCGGDFFYTGGPLGGDYTNRRIVRASLNHVTPAPAVAAAAPASN